MKERRVLVIVAVLCVLAQLGLGASSALGLVLCVGADHAAVESPGDHCCTGHGAAEPAIEASCCDDLPLVSAWRSVADVRRDHGAPVVVVTVAISALHAVAAFSTFAQPVVPSASPFASRTTILRV